MSKNLLWLLVAAAFVMPLGCSSEEDEDTPPPPAAFGPSLIAVGQNGNILTSPDSLNWTKITATGTLASLDLVKVVRVPNHANRRLVTFGRDDGAATNNAEIWYSDNGGSTWTQGTITLSTATGAHGTGWSIVDMIFVNELDGYAIGNDNIIIRTVNAGGAWTEMNTWNDGTVAAGPVEINLSYGGATPPSQGTTISQGGVSGTVVSWNDYNEYVVIDSITGGSFTASGTLTWSTTETGTYSAIVNTTWLHNFGTARCLYAVQSGTGASLTHTIFFVNDVNQSSVAIGPWKIVSSASAAGAAGRTFVWTSPTPAFQAYSAVGDFCYDDVHQMFFFDANTGVAARDDYGVLWTQNGGTSWTYVAALDRSGSEYWSEFVYTPANGGWLYAINYYGEIGRVGVLYNAAGTPPYTFDTAAGRAWALQTLTGSNSSVNDDHSGVVLWGGKIYAINQGSGSGYWSYGDSIANTTFTNDVFSDPSDTYRGATTALGANPIDDKYIEAASTTYYLEHWCER
jgi:hypothetical protein